MNNLVTSEVTGITYNPKDVVRILNMRQCAAFCSYGCKIVDVYPSVDYKTGVPIMVVLFFKNDTKEAYDLWCKHELVPQIKGDTKDE